MNYPHEEFAYIKIWQSIGGLGVTRLARIDPTDGTGTHAVSLLRESIL